MATVARRTPFQTPRGRVVTRSAWGAVGGSLLLLVLSGMFSAPAEDAGEEDVSASAAFQQAATTNTDPDFAAPVPNAFRPLDSVNDVQGVAAPALPPVAGEDLEERAEDAGDYQEVMSTAVATAERFATYSWDEDPVVWVEGLPDLESSYREALIEEVPESWEALGGQRLIVVAEAVNTSPRLVYYGNTEGVARVAVTMRQSVTAGSQEPSVRSRSFLVDLARVGDEDAEEWQVTALLTA